MADKDCIFCKIVKGEIPCHKVYEDDDFLAFLDIAPFVEGHTLIIPKKHYRWVWQIKEPGLDMAAAKIAQAMMENMPITYVSYFTLGWQIKHAHLHLVPRNKGDGLISEEGFNRKSISESEMNKIAERLKIFTRLKT